MVLVRARSSKQHTNIVGKECSSFAIRRRYRIKPAIAVPVVPPEMAGFLPGDNQPDQCATAFIPNRHSAVNLRRVKVHLFKRVELTLGLLWVALPSVVGGRSSLIIPGFPMRKRLGQYPHKIAFTPGLAELLAKPIERVTFDI